MPKKQRKKKLVQDLARVQVSEHLRRPKYVELVYHASRIENIFSLEHLKLKEKGIQDTFFDKYKKKRKNTRKSVRDLARVRA